MARYTDPVCRLCRREGMKLFLKGTKCFSDKCPIEKRNFAPGQHGKDRKAKIVGYGLQLREKQKAKRIYFTQEGQFRNYFEKAARTRGVTGEMLFAATGAPPGQCGLSPRFRHVPSPGAAVGASWPHPGEWTQGKHSFGPGQRGRRDCHPGRQRRSCPSWSRPRNLRSDQMLNWLEIDRDNYKGKVLACPSAKISTCR